MPYVNHHTGGLESAPRFTVQSAVVNHHTGGLEKKSKI